MTSPDSVRTGPTTDKDGKSFYRSEILRGDVVVGKGEHVLEGEAIRLAHLDAYKPKELVVPTTPEIVPQAPVVESQPVRVKKRPKP